MTPGQTVLWDTLFVVPFVSGLLTAALLSLIGALLRLRNEWLAALGLAHLAGAGALLGLSLHLPTVIGAPLGAMTGVLIKTLGDFRGNTVYALMILAGWSSTLLIAANTRLGSAIGHAMIEGQLYFAGTAHLMAAALLGVGMAGLYWLMPIMIRARFFPGQESANQPSAWRWHLIFDLLTALGMAIATATVGLMAAFALVFVPPWLAFRLARHWRHCLAISVGFGILGYVSAFSVALLMDQPFGPVLVVWLMGAAGTLLSWNRASRA